MPNSAADASGPIGPGGPNDKVRVVCLVVPEEDGDVAADRLWCAGATGVAEESGPDGRLEFHTVLGGSETHVLDRLGPLPPSWAVRFAEVDRRPADTWRRFAVPVEAAPGLWVAPAWWDGPMPNGTVLAIEPGEAFGLGDHPTTRLCLAALDRLDLDGARVLDVGCGSGVLSILAARRGAGSVTAIDIADAAVEATALNASANGVDVDVSATAIGDIAGEFDVIVANLLAPILTGMADDLVRVLAPEGRLIISGVLQHGFDHVVERLAPLRVADVDVLDGWAAIELGRPDAASARPTG